MLELIDSATVLAAIPRYCHVFAGTEMIDGEIVERPPKPEGRLISIDELDVSRKGEIRLKESVDEICESDVATKVWRKRIKETISRQIDKTLRVQLLSTHRYLKSL